MSSCPDGETFAAWHERTLPGAEMAVVDRHVADCARCRAMLAAFVRADAGSAATGVSDGVGALPLWKRWHLGWLVPLGATATAVALYIATPRPSDDRIITEEATAARVSETEPATELPARPEPELGATAPVAPAAPMAVEAPRESRLDALRDRAQAEADADDDRRANALAKQAPAESEATSTQPAPSSFAPVPAMPAPAVAGPSPALPAAPPPSAATLARSAPPAREEVAAPSSAPAAGALGAAEAAGARAPDALQEAASSNLRQRTADAARRDVARAVPVTASPAGLRFRVEGNRLERSGEDGAWSAVALPPGVFASDVTAGAAAGRAIWLIGRGGLVLRAPDGGQFLQVERPASVDLVSITAEDGRTATVVDSDGRRYSTSDSGGRWTAR